MDITDPAAQAAVRKISDAFANLIVTTALAVVELGLAEAGAPAAADPQPAAQVEKPARAARAPKATAASATTAAAVSPVTTASSPSTTASAPAAGSAANGDVAERAKAATLALNAGRGRAITVELLGKFDATKASEIDPSRLEDFITAAEAVTEGASVEDAIAGLGDSDAGDLT